VSRLFDIVVVVDWSSQNGASPVEPSENAVWIGVAGAEGEERYCRTRAEAIDWLTGFLAAEGGGGRRVLVGFDFPFGYPRGFAERMAGRAEALAVWEMLAGRVTDGPDNVNDRFAVADAINQAMGGAGPFWGRPVGAVLPSLPVKKPPLWKFPERRRVEAGIPSAKTCWQLWGAGSVGGQVLTGLPALWRLREAVPGAAVWPLESGFAVPEAPVVLAEVYPSLLAGQVAQEREADGVLDRVQVRVLARALAALDAAGGLAALFEAPGGLEAADRQGVAREEGWILGAGHASALCAAAGRSGARLRDDCFALPPGVDWVPVEVALGRLEARLAPVAAAERLALGAAGGRVLAAPVVAARGHPPAANSAVDGYGFAHAALGEGAQALPLVEGRAAAGAPFPGAVPEGRAVRVLTGALLPEGVDTVVLDEDATVADGAVRFARGARRGANTRKAGEDRRAGDPVLEAGRLIGPAEIALAAITGVAELEVFRPLRVAVLSTGDEIVEPGAAAAAHRTFDANRPMLLEMLRRWDMAAVDLGRVPDDAGAVAERLSRGAAEADAVLASGGASAGDEDHVARVLRARGQLETWRIAVKPGRPLALGLWQGVPVFGLPGNPVAAFVCALVFARPALMRLAGAPWQAPGGIVVPAAFEKDKKAGRREYLRARLDPQGAAEVFASEGSGRVSGLAWARGLVELEDGARQVRQGDPVRYLPFAEFGL
jgi:molybdopterin molybdotransferase